ncbi:hypothetical protein [Wenyingzhuangia aestuarii]|uniref:hypothetical protein n=1 Tax=Wenyingzhuangia aestuarii TaxID=1647582 RepID=UPI00143B418F|nr:hypothetical protein [Wenyingzhuangia aestuarii]NJB83634.1 hypothetical protein [Wenyingzhuangia aestuarii]
MIHFIPEIQTKLSEIQSIAYVDEDTGQLDNYSPNFPVKWPCALIDISSVVFSDIGKDRKKTPINRQNASGDIVITVANLKLTNTSKLAPVGQKQHAWSIHEEIQNIHEKLQGFRILENTSRLVRKRFRRTKRDDGVQQYEITYGIEATDV